MPYEQRSAHELAGSTIPPVFRASAILLIAAMIAGQVLQHRAASPSLIAGARRVAAWSPAVPIVIPTHPSDVDLVRSLDDWAIASATQKLFGEVSNARREAGRGDERIRRTG